MPNEIAPVTSSMSLAETEKLASHFLRSKYFKDATSESQAVVKILAGREMGLGAFASMQNLYVAQGTGTVQMRAQLMAYRIETSGIYQYRIKDHTDKKCVIEFFSRPNTQSAFELRGVETFTVEDAKRQGTQNMGKFPKNMLFARCLSNGARFYCPGIFVGGVNAYVPEEFGGSSFEEEVKPIPAAPAVDAEVCTKQTELAEELAAQQLSLNWVREAADLAVDSLDEIDEELAGRLLNLLAIRRSSLSPVGSD